MSMPPRPPPPRPPLASVALSAPGNSWPVKPSPRPSKLAPGSIGGARALRGLLDGGAGGVDLGRGRRRRNRRRPACPCCAARCSTRACAAPAWRRRRRRRSQTRARTFRGALPFRRALHRGMNDDRLIGDKLLHRIERLGNIEGDRGAGGQRELFGSGGFIGSRGHQTCDCHCDKP